jgi:hypothetical protein
MAYQALVGPISGQPITSKNHLPNLAHTADPIRVLFSIETSVLLPVLVLFGTPSKNCSGHGICDVTARSRPVPSVRGCCPQAPAFFLQLSESEFILLAPKPSLPETVAGRQFSKPFFEMEEAFPLPEFARCCFKLPANAHIPAGQHLFKQDEHFYTIYFDIRE